MPLIRSEHLMLKQGQLSSEPEQREHPANANVLAKDLRNRHAGVLQLFAAVVANGRDERRRLAHEAEALSPRVVHRDLGHLGLDSWSDRAALDR